MSYLENSGKSCSSAQLLPDKRGRTVADTAVVPVGRLVLSVDRRHLREGVREAAALCQPCVSGAAGRRDEGRHRAPLRVLTS